MFRGVFPAVLTPFDEDGSVNYNSFEKLCLYLADAHVHGVYLCGTTGEFPLLTVDERKQLTERAIASVGDRVTVLVQVGANALRPTIELAQHAQKSGAKGIGIIAPYFFTYDETALYRYYSAILESVPGFPTLLYNLPQRTGVNISLALMERLRANHDNLVGVKESGSFDSIHAWLTISDEKFCVFCGIDEYEYASFREGVRAIVCSFGNWLPHTFRKFIEAVDRDDWDTAQKMQRRIHQLVAPGLVPNQIAVLKAGMKLRGLPAGYLRSPNRDLGPGEIENLRQILESLNFLEGEQ
ncbi:MAG TPA: dihydrodipicolinate synthase family protein [bacterium]|nr:dihydrodipicolinate synthase family protein [bacterium]HQO33303.1 dihydrodipicolinate synthase family protein [bacterium]HQP98795.1 dihydrodipicolinate synthase family protein [bacterium]